MDKETSTDEVDPGSHRNYALSNAGNLESSTSEAPNSLGTPALNYTGNSNNYSKSNTSVATASFTVAATAASNAAD